MVVGREFIVNPIVLGGNRNGRVGFVKRVHGYLMSPARVRKSKVAASLKQKRDGDGGMMWCVPRTMAAEKSRADQIRIKGRRGDVGGWC